MLHTKVVILKIEVQVRQNQLIFDELPDDACHLVAIELYNCAFYFDL